MALTPEELEFRKTGLGASETPMLLGESPHGGPVALYMRKVGLADDWTSPAQEMGNILEDGMATYYANHTGATLSKATTLRHPAHPWFLATPDRYVNGRQKLLEVKIVGSFMAYHWKDTEDGIPSYVRIQVTQQMDVTGIHLCDVAALIGGTDPRIYQVEYDAELADGIREAAHVFWVDHVLPRIPPDSDGSDDMTALMNRLYPRSGGNTIQATDEMEAVAQGLRVARVNASGWEREQTRLEQEMMRLLGTNESVRGSDWAVTWRTGKKSRPFRFVADELKNKSKAA